ncbi:MAG: hypothetical protein QOK33_389, partial [Mycobacterium sp.]|nr:hypothetical protein [Mycobacterium sp.]
MRRCVGELIGDRLTEGGKVLRRSAGDEVPVDADLLVDDG